MGIHELKNELEEKKSSLHACKAFIKKREETAEKLDRLKQEVELKLLARHRYQSYRPLEAEKIRSELEKDQEQLKSLGKELARLDLLLEGHDDDAENELTLLKERLLASLCAGHSEAQEAYEIYASSLRRARTLKEDIDALEEKFNTFRHHLQEGASTRDAAKKRGLLDYIFGRNPKVVLSQHIHLASIEAEKLLRSLEPLQKDPIYKDFHSFLTGFLLDAQKPWNQSLYNQKFYTLAQQFAKLWEELSKERKHIENEIAEKESAIDQLIDRFLG